MLKSHYTLFISLFYLIYSFPYSNNQIIDYINIAQNSYENNNLDKFIYSFENQYGLKAKAYLIHNAIIISFRGSIINILGLSPENSEKFNKNVDNNLFNCCKDKDCILNTKKTIEKYRYISDSIFHIDHITKVYPKKRIILTGHSLGGSLASIIGRIKKLDVLAFSSPGEKHISDLFSKNSTSNIIHLGACSDSIYNGKCNSIDSSCSLMGYKIETKCHCGRTYCVGIDYVDNILFHKISVLYYLMKFDGNIIEKPEKGCKECVIEKQNGLLKTIIDNIPFLNNIM